jgi:hypothetical protein
MAMAMMAMARRQRSMHFVGSVGKKIALISLTVRGVLALRLTE